MEVIDNGESDVDQEHLQELFASSPRRANNRKRKLIILYEWEITLKWKGENMILLTCKYN